MLSYVLFFFGFIIANLKLFGANNPKVVIRVTRQNEQLRENEFFEMKLYPIQQKDMASFVLSRSVHELLSLKSTNLVPSADAPKPLAVARTMGSSGLAILNLEHPANQFEISVQKFRLIVNEDRVSGKNFLQINPLDESPFKKETNYIEDFCERNLMLNLNYGNYSRLHYSHLSELKILHKFTFTIVVTDDMRISFGPHSYIFHLRCSDGRVKNNFLFESKPGAFGETKIELYDELCESGIYQLNIAMVKSKGQGLYEIMDEDNEYVQCPLPSPEEKEIFYKFFFSFNNHKMICYKMDKSGNLQEQLIPTNYNVNGQKMKRKMFNFMGEHDQLEIEDTNSKINGVDEFPKTIDLLATFNTQHQPDRNEDGTIDLIAKFDGAH